MRKPEKKSRQSQAPTRISATFSPDGRTFAACQGSERTCQIWSTEDGKSIMRIHHPGWPREIAFSPDGRRALIVSTEQPSYLSGLWDLSSGAEIAVLRGHESETHGGTFSHDGRLAATVSIEGTARLWDGVTGELRSVLGEESGLKSHRRRRRLRAPGREWRIQS